MKQKTFNKGAILLLTLGISIIFIVMIKGFLMAIFLAALFAGVLYPVYKKLEAAFKGKSSPAAFATLFLFIMIIIIPLSGFMIIVIRQAINASTTVKPIIEEVMNDPDAIVNKLESIPIIQQLFPEQEQLVNTIDDVVSSIGNFLVQGFSDFSAGTANFIFLFFIFLFTLYYFLVYGKDYLKTILYYMPLKNDEEHQLLVRFTKVTKATLKGTFLIGTIQGVMGGLGMFIVGLPNVLFWGLVMTILSIIPALGPAIVWVPASILLILQGKVVNAIILALIGAVLIGNIDNILRPKLVGKDAQMPDLMILFGTLGGLALFGIAGVIIGPIIAALFISIWDIYGHAFHNYLYPVVIDSIHKEGGEVNAINTDDVPAITRDEATETNDKQTDEDKKEEEEM